ncbi:hypothetical protein [Paraburkholderia sp. HD33-4]|uniref:hypothetical protein n=1 Tax=Paraburkholderia sp. HD33-4 TaxID=2883242 RepID=UPI001F3C0417|nr:hypothetical protein [Paraburkholderia sp. HD33-4]
MKNTNQNNNSLIVVALLVCAVTFLAYLGLTPLGVWHDEFITLGHVREDGFGIIRERLLHWSPRPLSEMFLWAYGIAVEKTNRPLIATALLPTWVLLFCAVLGPSAKTRKGFVASAVLLILLLVGHKVDEVFYWPVGALAYVPTVAAMAILLSIDFAGFADTTAGRVVTLIALVTAATSTEIGALFAAGYCVLALVVSVITKDRLKLWWLVPFAISLGVLYMMVTGRVEKNIEMFGDHSIVHHPAAALWAAASNFWGELFGTDVQNASTLTTLAVYHSKLAFFCGTYFLFSLEKEPTLGRSQLMRLGLAISLIGAAFLMLAAAYFQFGMACCERHATMRQAYFYIALGALGLFAARFRPVRAPRAGLWLLIVSVLLPLSTEISGIANDYRHYRAIMDARIAMWESGLSSGDSMTVSPMPPARIAGSYDLPAGAFVEGDGKGGPYAMGMQYFFKKKSVIFDLPSP